MQLINEKHIIGQFCSDVYTIKYQKRALLHIHFLFSLYSKDQIFDSVKINQIISTKVPTKEYNLTGIFFGIVLPFMLYDLCRNYNPICYI